LSAFLPVGRITGTTPGAQAIVVEAGHEFQVVRVDYCNQLGAAITSREVKPALIGTHVELLIAQDYLEHLLFDSSAHPEAGRQRRLDISFRVHRVVLGHPRVVSVAGRLEKQDGMTATLVG